MHKIIAYLDEPDFPGGYWTAPMPLPNWRYPYPHGREPEGLSREMVNLMAMVDFVYNIAAFVEQRQTSSGDKSSIFGDNANP
jgi:hypothetical protein